MDTEHATASVAEAAAEEAGQTLMQQYGATVGSIAAGAVAGAAILALIPRGSNGPNELNIAARAEADKVVALQKRLAAAKLQERAASARLPGAPGAEIRPLTKRTLYFCREFTDNEIYRIALSCAEAAGEVIRVAKAEKGETKISARKAGELASKLTFDIVVKHLEQNPICGENNEEEEPESNEEESEGNEGNEGSEGEPESSGGEEEVVPTPKPKAKEAPAPKPKAPKPKAKEAPAPQPEPKAKKASDNPNLEAIREQMKKGRQTGGYMNRPENIGKASAAIAIAAFEGKTTKEKKTLGAEEAQTQGLNANVSKQVVEVILNSIKNV
uniref:Uncharacterized protein n=1 Tax=viral metagenome TaxID=1070528 RepID=A0A6C0KXZ0_9ZZZZ